MKTHMHSIIMVSELSWHGTACGVYTVIKIVTPYIQRPSRDGLLQASVSQQD